ncbi:MAG: hypothetical protein LBR69_03935 [Endomicrobium sp.]|jgi:glycerophosphoryl diester phosphodiesterase|nr:hypothetical protein [Endomicrobium sp.]
MKKAFILMFFVILSAGAAYATEIISHRGYWDTAGSAQDSVTSLTNAHNIKAYGSEMDVYITTDNVVVVNHDAALWGISIENNSWDRISQTRLPNGEDLPTFEKYISAHKELGGDTKLIIEVKRNINSQNDKRVVDAVLALVKKYGVEDKVEYASLGIDICDMIAAKAPKGTAVVYLAGNLSPKKLKKHRVTGFNYPAEVMMLNPNWIKQAKKRGLTSGAWTVNDREKLQWCIDRKVDFVTTDKPVLLREMIENKKVKSGSEK